MKNYKGLFLLFSIVVSIQVLMGIAISLQFPEGSDRGTFGDMFGAVNTLFSGLAFAGVIYAIILQGKELALQRQELEMTRSELAKAAEAQTEQAGALLRAAKINALSSRLSMYTTLLVNNRTLPNQSHTNTGDAVASTLNELNKMLTDNV